MIEFDCESCGVRLRVPDDKGGKRGKCPRCASVIRVPVAPRPARTGGPAQAGSRPGPATGAFAEERARILQTQHDSMPRCPACNTPLPPGSATCPSCNAPAGAAQAPGVAATGKPCPSCGKPLPQGAKVCVECGIYADSGRPVLMARGLDEGQLEARAESVIRPISWLIPFGLYPIYSEAMGKARPVAIWSITVITILVSAWFLVLDWTESPQMQSYKNLMLWSGKAEPDADRILTFYATTSYGDTEAFAQALAAEVDKRGVEVEHIYDLYDTEAIRKAHESLPPEKQCFGRYRPSQLVTHALLHGGILHLAGNLLFLLIFGSRVNAAVGNIATVVLYVLFAVAAGAAQMASSAGEMPTPMLGASGAVMGMAGMYLVLFPMHKVHMAFWLRFGLIGAFRLWRKTFAVWGFVVVLFYIAFDVLYVSLGMETGTAHWAHLGGFIAGMFAALVLLTMRFVHSRSDLLSLVFGKYAWGLVGTPHSHASKGTGARRLWSHIRESGNP